MFSSRQTPTFFIGHMDGFDDITMTCMREMHDRAICSVLLSAREAIHA
jgi:hypothetical protein